MSDNRHRFHVSLTPAVWEALVSYCDTHKLSFGAVTHSALTAFLGVEAAPRSPLPRRPPVGSPEPRSRHPVAATLLK